MKITLTVWNELAVTGKLVIETTPTAWLLPTSWVNTVPNSVSNVRIPVVIPDTGSAPVAYTPVVTMVVVVEETQVKLVVVLVEHHIIKLLNLVLQHF